MSEVKEKVERKEKIIASGLYALPILFFIICYFLIVTSGEDIYQGAGTPPNIIHDALAAFNHSARLADMFAWAVINFFDYTFKFGIDTVFRIIDVVAAGAVFYMATYLVLMRRPRLKIKDAGVFLALFLIVMLTSNGPTIYSGFSKIHNYLFISIFTLLFSIVVARRMWGRERKIKNLILYNLMVFLLAFLFGLASNVSGVVVLLTVPCYFVYSKLTKQKIKLREVAKEGGLTAGLGIIAALIIIYGIGPGLNDYETSSAYLIVCDYLTFTELFSNLGAGIVRIIKHNVYNFGKFLLPLAVTAGGFVAIFWRKIFDKKGKRNWFSQEERNYLVLAGIFIVVHILALSQIYYPTRLMFSIYLFAAAVLMFVIKRIIEVKKIKLAKGAIIGTMAGMAVAIIGMRTYFAVDYLKKVGPELERIRTSETQEVCVPKEIYYAPFIKYLHLNQEDFLVDWALPQKIYGKDVSFCEEEAL